MTLPPNSDFSLDNKFCSSTVVINNLPEKKHIACTQMHISYYMRTVPQHHYTFFFFLQTVSGIERTMHIAEMLLKLPLPLAPQQKKSVWRTLNDPATKFRFFT